MRNERGGIVGGWLLKAIIGFVIGGVILFDTGKIAINFFGLDGAADEIANQVAQDVAAGKFPPTDVRTLNTCTRRPTNNQICTEIQKKVKEKDACLIKVTVDAQNVLKIRIKRTTDTLVVEHIGLIEDWATATSEGEAELDIQ